MYVYAVHQLLVHPAMCISAALHGPRYDPRSLGPFLTSKSQEMPDMFHNPAVTPPQPSARTGPWQGLHTECAAEAFKLGFQSFLFQAPAMLYLLLVICMHPSLPTLYGALQGRYCTFIASKKQGA